MRIDAHHSFSERYPLDHLGSILARNRFEGSILVGPLMPTPDFIRGIVVTTFETLDECLRHPKFRGVQWSESVRPLLSELEARRIPLDVAGQLAAAVCLAEAHPHLPVVIDHLGAPAGPDWNTLIDAAAQLPNVYCKLSGLTMFEPSPRNYVQHALAIFPADRLMFGSDWPASLPEYAWKQNLAVFTQSIGAQTIEYREQLLGGTAARVYGL